MRALLLTTVLLASACGGDGPQDAGAADAARDAAAHDGGDTPDLDAAAPDAHVPDASSMGADAGDGGVDGGVDAGVDREDAGAGTDAGAETDAGATRTTLLPTFCPSVATPAGLYRGTLALNLNEHSSACGLSAPGRDGFVRVEVAPGQTLRAAYRHAGDGVLYLLDNCPVLSSCLDQSDGSISGAEEVEWTNTSATTNPVYLGLDAAELGPPETFELDIHLTP